MWRRRMTAAGMSSTIEDNVRGELAVEDLFVILDRLLRGDVEDVAGGRRRRFSADTNVAIILSSRQR